MAFKLPTKNTNKSDAGSAITETVKQPVAPKKTGKKDSKKTKNLGKLKNWYQDRYETILIQRNILLIIVFLFIFVFFITIRGVIELNSSKVYEPFIVQIEEATGIITKVDNSEVRNLPAEKAVRNASMVRYILARESYNYADYNFNYYQITRLMSSEEVYRAFQQGVNSNISLGFEKKIDVRIKSFITMDETQNLIQIRISKAVLPVGSVGEDAFNANAKNYIITLRYEYRSLDLTETERYINPLGMQIIAYRIDEENNVKN
jgi:type IV secretion system protein VirB8